MIFTPLDFFLVRVHFLFYYFSNFNIVEKVHLSEQNVFSFIQISK